MQAATWMNPENSILSEISQTQKETLYDSSCLKGPEQANLQRQKVDQSCQGLVKGENCNRYGILFQRGLKWSGVSVDDFTTL